MVMSSTKIVKDGAATRMEDLKVGDHVMIHFMTMGDMLMPPRSWSKLENDSFVVTGMSRRLSTEATLGE